MVQPLVSVIVPIYNVLPYLPKCVESLLAQTYERFELILVDDGSTDGSGEYCDRYATDQRVQVIHQANAGLSAARNAGLKVAQGEYIAFIDGDDYVHPQMLEVLARAAVDNQCDLSICGFNYVHEHSSAPQDTLHDVDEVVSKRQTILDRDALYARLFSTDWTLGLPCVVVWNKLYSRSLIGDTLFIEGTAEDDRFNAMVYKDCSRAVMVDASLYRYLQRPNSLHVRQFQMLSDIHVLYEIYHYLLQEASRYAPLGLVRVYKQFVHGLLAYRGTEYERPLRAFYKEVRRDTFGLWIRDRHTSLFQKAHFLLFWHCPWLYDFCIKRLLPRLERLR